MKTKITITSIMLIMLLLYCTAASALTEPTSKNQYTIPGANGNVTICWNDVKWQGEKGCWDYANAIYKKIWNYNFTNSFGSSDNMLKNLTDDERTINLEHTKEFLSKAPLGSTVRIASARKDSDPNAFAHDGTDDALSTGGGKQGHSIIIVAKTNNGITYIENLNSGRNEDTKTYQDFVNDYAKKYKYFKYIKAGRISVLPPSYAANPTKLEFRNIEYPKVYSIASGGFTIGKGAVVSNSSLKTLMVKIETESGKVISSMSSPRTISGNYFCINNLDGEGKDNGQKFSLVKTPGEYVWVMTATDSAGKTETLRMKFTAVASGKTVTAIAPENGTVLSPVETPLSGVYQFNKNDDSRSGPGEAYAKVADQPKGSIVFVVASVVNQYNNTWYKTQKGSYVYSKDVDKVTLKETTLSGNYKFNKDDESRTWPYEDSLLVKSYKNGSAVTVTAQVTNTYGNVWYKLADGSYVYSKDVEAVTATPPASSQPYDNYNSAYKGWYTVQKTQQYLSINDKPSSNGKTYFDKVKNGWYVHLADAEAAAGTAKKWGWLDAAYDPNTKTWYQVSGYACMYYLKKNSSQNDPGATSIVQVNDNPRKPSVTTPAPTAVITPTPAPTATPAPQIISEGSCGDNVRWSYDGDTLYITGTGEMVGRNSNNEPVWGQTIHDAMQFVEIQSGVTSIGASAFKDAKNVIWIDIASTVNTIGASAFRSTGIYGITLPSGIKEVASDLFDGCTKLEAIEIPDGVTKIYARAFEDCYSLKRIYIPSSVVGIDVQSSGGSANPTFTRCSEDLTIYAPKGSYAIQYAKENGILYVEQENDEFFDLLPDILDDELVDDEDIPVGDYVIGNAQITIENDGEVVYTGTTEDEATVTIPDEITIPEGTFAVTRIENKAFYKSKKLTTITIGKNIKTIGKSAFASCKKLKTVKGGAAVTSIGASAFASDVKLKTIPTFGKLQTIGASAFKGDKALTKVTISKNVKSIGKNAFNGCAKLKTITIKTTKLTTSNVKANAFKGISKKATIKVPKDKLKAYKTLLVKKGVPKTAKIKK